MRGSVLKIPSNFPIKKTIKVENGSQTKQMPIIAIENNHVDCIHGPYIASPIDMAVANLDPTSTKKINTPTKEQSTQTCFEYIEIPGEIYESKSVQTEFTSFTKPAHFMYPGSPIDNFLVLNNAEKLESLDATRKAEAFNQDFFMRHGNLFSIKFIIAYFHSRFTQSKL